MRIDMNRWKNFLAATIAILAVAVAAPRAQNLVASPTPTVLPPAIDLESPRRPLQEGLIPKARMAARIRAGHSVLKH